MSSSNSKPHEVVIDGVKITPGIIQNLKDLQQFGAIEAKNCIAHSSLFIASLPGDCEEIEKEFYVLQRVFYQLCSELNGESDSQEGEGHHGS